MLGGEAVMKVGYYPGCSLHSTAREYEQSLQAIAPALNIQFEEIQDWACCGASSAHVTNHLLSIALPARTLMLAQKQDLGTVFAPCATCFNRLAAAHYAISRDSELALRIRATSGVGLLEKEVRVLSVAHLLLECIDDIRRAAVRPLRAMKIACYYGCLLLRPSEVCRLDDPEAPTALERIVSATGAVPVKWDMASECCGGAFSQSRTTSVVRLGRAIIRSARAAGAHAIVVACPMCHSNLDYRQQAMSAHEQEPLLPILYVSQLLGLSVEMDPLKLGLGSHFVSTEPLVNRIGTGGSRPESRGQSS
jgi:heterodisulfide reductase subunit B2